MKKQLPETSKEAYKKVSAEMLQGHWGIIVKALKALGTANYEKISGFSFMERHQVGRRLKELEQMEIVYKPGSKSKTKSGRDAFDYCLTGQGLAHTEKELKDVVYKNNEKTAADYASQLANPLKQINLF